MLSAGGNEVFDSNYKIYRQSADMPENSADADLSFAVHVSHTYASGLILLHMYNFSSWLVAS